MRRLAITMVALAASTLLSILHRWYRRPAIVLLPAIARLALDRLGWLLATGDERDAEVLALRHQLLVLQRQVARPKFTDTDRTILAVLSTAIDRARHTQAFHPHELTHVVCFSYSPE